MEQQSKERVVTQGWDETEKSTAGGGAWMKWDDQQVHQLNVCGVPQHVEKSFDGEPPKQRVVVDVYVPGEGIKKWEMAPATYRDLADERREAKSPFGDALIAVKRVGMSMKTQYKMRYQRPLNAAELAERAAAGGATSGIAGTDIPF